MNTDRQVAQPKPHSPARIWYQSFVDPGEQHPYIARLEESLKRYADPDVSFQVHDISPPDRYLNPLTEFRCAAQTIRNAIKAEEQGYDAFVIGHFQEPGLIECRSAVDIPVIGLGEATMLHACTLGRTFGLVTINPIFIPWHRDQITRLGLSQRATGVRAIDTQVSTYLQAFEEEDVYQRVREAFCREVLLLVEEGPRSSFRPVVCRCYSSRGNKTSRFKVPSC
ncbi:MAG: aspartate/glutamate racemase family protein [Gammaproteobacteria bacterium]